VLVLLQPLTLLGLTAITLAVPGDGGTSNPGFHGISQVFYEFASAFANNGSGRRAGRQHLWWNLSCALVLALGRSRADHPAGHRRQLAAKRQAPEAPAACRWKPRPSR
jgi:K+-transporting ATPase ATPase A chain